MDIDRREFFKTSASMLGASAAAAIDPLGALADEKRRGGGKPTMVVVYLRGGSDPLNMIVPYREDLYYSLRPTIAIPKPDVKGGRGAIALDRQFGLNPNLKALFPLYRRGICAPILNVGSHHSTRSHFDAQDFMEYAAPGSKIVSDGWLNRYLKTTASKGDSELRAVAMQPLLPRALRGEYPAIAVPGFRSERELEAFDALYGCKELHQRRDEAMKGEKRRAEKTKTEEEVTRSILASGRNTIDTLRRLEKLTSGSGAVRYPASPFGEQMRRVARVIKADRGLEIAAVDYRGWDHHARQGGVDGVMARMLADLSSVLAAFAEDLGPHLDRTLVLTMTEFGRTVAENGNNGSDHGHGGIMLAIGGMVRGGRIYGKWTGLERSSLWQGRDLPVHTDFRLVMAEALFRLYRFQALRTRFFPNYSPTERPLGFLKQV